MKKVLILLAVSIGWCVSLHAAKPAVVATVAAEAVYSAENEMASKVINPECKFNSQVVQAFVKDIGKGIKVADKGATDTKEGNWLTLALNNSPDTAEASAEKPLWMTVEGVLFHNGTGVGDFIIRQEIEKGSFQNCKTLSRLAGEFAGNITSWISEQPSRYVLVAPVMSAASKEAMDEEKRIECKLDTLVPKYLAENAEGRVGLLMGDAEVVSKQRRLLKLQVVDSRIVGGGTYSGAKWITLKGELVDGEKITASFEAKAWSAVSFSSFSACKPARIISEDLANYIAEWMKNPTMNAKLGSLDESKKK